MLTHTRPHKLPVCSALDAHVAKEVYETALLGHFKRLRKTVLFVTNRLEFVGLSDRVCSTPTDFPTLDCV